MISNNKDVAIPGCSTEKTKRNLKAKRQTKTVCTVQAKKQKCTYLSDTEVSGSVSTHSDSDIFEIEDEENVSEAEFTERKTKSYIGPMSDKLSYDYANTRIKRKIKLHKNILNLISKIF